MFIGGSTEWKMSVAAAAVIAEAKRRGKWIHVGRISTPRRAAHFEPMHVNSFDGSGIARFSHMRLKMQKGRLCS